MQAGTCSPGRLGSQLPTTRLYFQHSKRTHSLQVAGLINLRRAWTQQAGRQAVVTPGMLSSQLGKEARL